MSEAYELAKSEVGTVEWKDGHNPKVVAYFKDAGHAWVKDDETAWCAAFVGAMLKRAGITGTGKLTARSYLDWGVPVDFPDAVAGDIAVFTRGKSTWQGHVAFYVRHDAHYVYVLGGNQSNAVNVSKYPISGLLGLRRDKTAPVLNKPNPVEHAPVASKPVDVSQPAPGSRQPGLVSWLIDLIMGWKK